MSCIFCDISQKRRPADIVHEDQNVLAFRDIHAQAPHHILIIPRKHIHTLNDITQKDIPLMGEIVRIASQIAAELGFDQDGYRLVMNCNRHGGQSVFHVHCHLLGGRWMSWPPG
jgi:histidine triad (HIT) family protein